MSNFTSSTSEATASQNPTPAKKKRNLPGNPDPDAEVIALSPKTLMATNRFMCEICNKGFQRDQNLQLHRRGHNLPWKLKQRANKDVIKKKVYICPEVSCVHHCPSRALGDLTGIKKHFSRKHGEKKYKCEKCSKKYAVQSDWKAHSKTCGTREYKCDCGTIFSRRDSFITHRAFCDALAEESSKAIRVPNPISITAAISNNHNSINPHQLLFSSEQQKTTDIHLQPHFPSPNVHDHDELSLKREQVINFNRQAEAQKLWPHDLDQFSSFAPLHNIPLPSAYNQPSPHLSATALLQKAAEMGATMSTHTSSNASNSSSFGLVHGGSSTTHSPLLQEMMMMSSTNFSFDGETTKSSKRSEVAKNHDDGLSTKDFLGLKAFQHKDLFSMGVDLDPCMRPSFENDP